MYVNNDSTRCMDGDLMCIGEYTSINRIRVKYVNDGISSEWVNINTFDGLLQVTIQTKKDLTNFLVLNPKNFNF